MKTSIPNIAKNATAPMTPPAIAPTFFFLAVVAGTVELLCAGPVVAIVLDVVDVVEVG